MCPGGATAPLGLLQANPHYLSYRGQATILVGATEHYGAVLNSAFDYLPYLEELYSKGLNLTRIFSGVYLESPTSFGIAQNTLAPAQGQLLSPFARSQTPGYAGGGNKFDLYTWDAAYFQRLRHFVAAARQRDIMVEYVLFCPFYAEEMWALSPLNAANNVNGLGALPRTQAMTLTNGPLLAVQLALVRKVVAALQEFENVYYEICNEPYIGGVTLAWQHRIAEAIAHADGGRHLIAQNIANGAQRIEDPHPAVSIFNFHYATPQTVGLNWGLPKVIANDETGTKGIGDAAYRQEAWEFFLAGGGVFNHLDYSFTTETPRGTFALPAGQPGGGGASLRHQLGVLKAFIEQLPFTQMAPDHTSVTGGVPEPEAVPVLAQAGVAYGMYLRGKGVQIEMMLPEGVYEVDWVNVFDGKRERRETVQSPGQVVLQGPDWVEEVAVKVERHQGS